MLEPRIPERTSAIAGTVSSLIAGIQKKYSDVKSASERSHAVFQSLVADCLALLFEVERSVSHVEELKAEYKMKINRKLPEGKLAYAIGVLAIGSNEREEMKKGGKIGRVIRIMRERDVATKEQALELLKREGGVDGILKAYATVSRKEHSKNCNRTMYVEDKNGTDGEQEIGRKTEVTLENCLIVSASKAFLERILSKDREKLTLYVQVERSTNSELTRVVLVAGRAGHFGKEANRRPASQRHSDALSVSPSAFSTPHTSRSTAASV